MAGLHLLEGVEEVADFEGGALGLVGAVGGVAADAGAEALAEGAFGGVGGVGGAHEVAPAEDGVLALQDHDRHGAFGHEVLELLVEALAHMLVVEALADGGGQAGHLQALDGEAALLDGGDDLADMAFLDGVGLDDGESAFNGHDSSSSNVPVCRKALNPSRERRSREGPGPGSRWAGGAKEATLNGLTLFGS